MITLNQIKNNQEVEITEITADTRLLYTLSSIGIAKGSKIKRLRASPLGDPVLYLVKNTRVAIRKRDAAGVEVKYYD